jgi:hypothetical protein
MPALAVDINQIVRDAAERQKLAERKGSAMRFVQVEVKTDFDSDRKPSAIERRQFVSLSEGSGVSARELVEINGRAPTEKEREKVRQEDEKRRRTRAGKEAASETEDDDLMSGRLPLSDLLTRFDFRLVGEEPVEGRMAYVVEFGPKPGLVSKTLRDRVLNNFAGKAWIDVVEHQIYKIDGHLTTSVKVAGGLALDLQEVKIIYEGRPVYPGYWAPCREEIQIKARAAMIFKVNKEMRFEFSGYEPLHGHSASPEKAVVASTR